MYRPFITNSNLLTKQINLLKYERLSLSFLLLLLIKLKSFPDPFVIKRGGWVHFRTSTTVASFEEGLTHDRTSPFEDL